MPKDVSLTSSKTSPSCVGGIDVMPAGGIDVMPADCIDVMPTGCIDVLPAGCMTGIPFTQATGLLPAAISSLRTTGSFPVSYTHLRAHETRHDLVCRLLLEKKK